MRALLLLLAVLVIPGFMFSVSAGSGSTPLDLPARGLADNEDDEDAPETITFYGSELEGQHFFFCFPAYSFCGVFETFISIKEEVAAAVMQMSPRVRFSAVAYNTETYVWQWKLKRGTMANKASCIAWMDVLTTGGFECLLDAGLTSLQILNQDRHHRKAVLVCLGGNTPTCQSGGSGYPEECLTQITGANIKRHRINTVYIDDVYVGKQAFWQELAAANNGTSQTK